MLVVASYVEVARLPHLIIGAPLSRIELASAVPAITGKMSDEAEVLFLSRLTIIPYLRYILLLV